ncbi:MAG: PD40 domain-containing protein [Planctomycetes bacterium]|nr:PD40 domain-containing protein [Planctomycetota bacterium]
MSIPFPFSRLAALVLALPVVLSHPAEARSERDLLFTDSATATAALTLDTPVARARTAVFDVDALAAPGARVRIEFFPGDAASFVAEQREESARDEFTWSGRATDGRTGSATFAVSHGALCGSVRIGDRLLRLRSQGAATVVIEEIDERRVPPCSTTSAQRIATTAPHSHPPAPVPTVAFSALASAPTIDVLVVYTPQARAGQGGTAAMQALIDLAVLETNQAYQASGVTQKLRLAHRAELTGYVEANNWGIDLGRLYNPNDGQLDYVHAWRAQCGADIIVLIVDAQGGSCGVAFLMGTLDPNFGPNAFALVSRTCATGFYTFGHELGHVMGLAHDRDNGSDKTMRASYSSTLQQGNAPSYSPVISALGGHVAFVSSASNLVPGDSNGLADVFLRDRNNYTTERVNVSSAGVQADGAPVSAPALSQSGAFVAFDSTASSLVAGDTNGVADVFVRDVTAGTTTRVSLATSGAEGNGASYAPALSLDGRFVAFTSDATNFAHSITTTQVYLHDRQTGTTQLVSRGLLGIGGNGASGGASVSADGRYVAFTSTSTDLVALDTNGKSDIFVRDMLLGTTVRASVATGGLQSNDDSPFAPTLTPDGSRVVFTSSSSNLVANDTNGTWDVFVHDLTLFSTVRVSVGAAGAQGNGPSGWMARSTITADGRYVAFGSRASNLVPGDNNGSDDAFVHDLQTQTTVAVSVTPSGLFKPGHSANVDQNSVVSQSSPNGDAVVFVSSAVLEVIDSNSVQDVYLFLAREPNPAGVDDYSFGYRTPNQQYRTIMSYAPGTRLQRFSNPNISFAGFPLGIADPDPYAAECWRTLNNTASTVAAWTPSVYLPYCAGDGSAAACPCGNASAADSEKGCLNSLALAGSLTARGTASLSNDTVELRGAGMPNGGALYFQGTAQVSGGSGLPYGDGLLCVTGTIRRLGVKFNTANASQLPVSGDPTLSTLGLLSGAGTAYYQVWYRDAVVFCAGETFNFTNALGIVWSL